MKFPPASLVTLVRLLRRDGFAFFGKCVRYGSSRDAWLWLFRGGRFPEEASTSVFVPKTVPDADDAEEREASLRVLRGWKPEISVVVASRNYARVNGETL